MKRIVSITAFVFVFVLCFWQEAKAYQKDELYKEWRSTITCSVDTDVLVATGAIHIELIQTTSGTLGSGGFQFFNTTGTVANGVSRSSSPVYTIEDTNDTYLVKRPVYKGFRYTKTGTSCVEVLWDWIGLPPRGFEDEGIMP